MSSYPKLCVTKYIGDSVSPVFCQGSGSFEGARRGSTSSGEEGAVWDR